MMQEHGLLTDKGNPSVSGIAEQNEHYTPLLLKRLSFKLQFRENSFECIRNTYLKMYSEKDYTGMFLFTVLMYGLIGWRTPLNLNLMSAVYKRPPQHFSVKFSFFSVVKGEQKRIPVAGNSTYNART